MITIFVKATDPHRLRDLLRSLVNNAESRDNYRIVIGGETTRHGEWVQVASEFSGRAEIVVVAEGGVIELEATMVWILDDDVFVLGYQWDKRILHYADAFDDGIVVMCPSGVKPYAASGVEVSSMQAERHPIVSAEWTSLVGLQDVDRICQELALTHGVDRRIDMRLLDVQWRGQPTPITTPATPTSEIKAKAQGIRTHIGDYRSALLNGGSK